MQDYIPIQKDINEKLPTVTVKQYDNLSRFLHIQIFDNDLPDLSDDEKYFNLENCTARLYVQPKGDDSGANVAYIDGEVADGEKGIVTFLLPSSITETAGNYDGEIWIYGAESSHSIISTKPFDFVVEKSIRNDSAIEGTSKFTALDNVLSDNDLMRAQMAALIASPAGTGGDVGTELRDIRTGYDGTEYETAGVAVRTQITDLKSVLSDLVDYSTVTQEVTATQDSGTVAYGTGSVSTSAGTFNSNYTSYDTYLFTPETDGYLYITRNGGNSLRIIEYNTSLTNLPTTSTEANTLYVRGAIYDSSTNTLPTAENKWFVSAGHTLAISRINATYISNFTIYFSFSVNEITSYNGDIPLANEHIEQVLDSDTIANLIKSLKSGDLMSKTKTGTSVIVDGKNPKNYVYDASLLSTVKGVNRFNVANFSFSKNSSSSNATLTRAETGISIVSEDTASSNRFYYGNYTAECDGKLWISFNAKSLTQRTTDCRLHVMKNGTEVAQLVGEGKQRQWIEVANGDTIQLRFYYHLYTSTDTNSVEYTNIMLAFDDIDDYIPFVSDSLSNTIKRGSILVFSESTSVQYEYESETKNYKCVCFGDSITGMFDNGADYPYIVQKMTDVECINCGFSGSRLTDHSSTHYIPFSLNRLIESVVNNDFTYQDDHVNSVTSDYYAKHLANLKAVNFSEVDFVTILIGTNDWGSNTILNSNDDTSTDNKQRTNVEDALKYCIEQLENKYPHLTIFVICPYWRNISESLDSDVDANNNGDYLYEFADVMEQIAHAKNCKCENLYHTLGANSKTKYYWTIDGTHPTTRAKTAIANRIKLMMDNSGVYSLT